MVSSNFFGFAKIPTESSHPKTLYTNSGQPSGGMTPNSGELIL
ncbi:hypothetical protein COLO4_32960 [Corchorus olitorius]|uniref:Uncharacterized protein n=1 Tax=Corchorus olitorius TaxID=93759 RepID=A0A1R3GX08_9ROSI|nr:hypothetical protein COLO4_32960 [Corchorus olitorius]